MAAEASAPRKGPGRPRKRPAKEPLPRLGIVGAPMNPNSRLEIVYDKSITMKKLFTVFKQLNVHTRIIMRATERSMSLEVIDHTENVKTRATFNGELLNRYYCGEPITVDLSAAELATVIQLLTKACVLVTLTLEVTPAKTVLCVALKMDGGAEKVRRVNIIDPVDRPAPFVFDEEKYAIKVVMSAAAFKGHIVDISKIARGGTFQINQTGNRPLEFIYANDGESIRATDKIAGEDCKVESSLPEEGIVAVNVQPSYVSPLSVSLLADEWMLAIDNKKPLLIRGVVDKGVLVIEAEITTS